MAVKAGILCSDEGLALAALLRAQAEGRWPLEIKIVIADRNSQALAAARNIGLYGAFVPRSAFHANRDGFERRLLQLLTEAGADTVILAGFERELGPVLTEAFPGRVLGQGLEPEELAAALPNEIRALNLSLAPRLLEEAD